MNLDTFVCGGFALIRREGVYQMMDPNQELPRPEMIPKPIWDIYTPEDLQRARRLWLSHHRKNQARKLVKAQSKAMEAKKSNHAPEKPAEPQKPKEHTGLPFDGIEDVWGNRIFPDQQRSSIWAISAENTKQHNIDTNRIRVCCQEQDKYVMPLVVTGIGVCHVCGRELWRINEAPKEISTCHRQLAAKLPKLFLGYCAKTSSVQVGL